MPRVRSIEVVAWIDGGLGFSNGTHFPGAATRVYLDRL